MRKLVFALAGVMVLSTCYSTMFGQGLPDMPQSNSSNSLLKSQEEIHDERLPGLFANNGVQVKREPRIIKKGPLAPSPQDVADNRFILNLSNTGLMRLMPREKVDAPDSEVAKKINLRGNGAYYSFFYLSHEYNYGSDIELQINRLMTGFAGCDYGFLIDLGLVPLDNLTIDDGRVAYLAQYEPPKKESEARAEARKSAMGFTMSGQEYRRSVPLKVGSTYLLRSIVYRYSDTLTAFTVTRQDDDGSAIIVWKRLKVFTTPKLLRNQ